MSFPSFQRVKYCAARLVFEEQECNSRGFCLAAMHPTNEKIPTFKASYAFLILDAVAARPWRKLVRVSRLMDF